MGEVPDLVFCKGFVLRGYSEPLIVWDEHLLGCLTPAGCLVCLYAKCACLLRIALHPFCCPAQVALGHEVGVDVVVGEGAVLVWSGDAVDAKLVGDGVEVPQRTPQSRRLDEQLEAHLLLERAVTGGLDVGGHSVGNVRVDMECGSTRRPVP